MEKTKDFLNKLLQKNDTIVIGVSGGPDSMCLLNILNTIKENLNLKIIVAHINHGLRKESEEEKEFVEKLCNKENLVFEYLKINFLNKKNIEKNARIKRYGFYEKLLKKYEAKYLMTAHHGDDLVETILMRLVRGSSFHGYAGFQLQSDFKGYKLIRPLIFYTKEDVLKYNKKNNIPYRIDKTNNDDTYTRNRFRHYVLPFLKKENKNIHQKFLKWSEEINAIEKYIENNTNSILTQVYDFGKVNLHEFKKLDLVLQKRVIEYILKEEYQEHLEKINEKHVQNIINLCNSTKANGCISLPLKKQFVKSYDKAHFIENQTVLNKEQILEDYMQITSYSNIRKLEKTSLEKSNYVIKLCSKEIVLPLKVRIRKQGDKMVVKNLNGQKKVKDIFMDEKIPKEKRDSWPIVVDSKDRILWIPGIKKSNFDKNNAEFYDIIYKYEISEEKKNE